MKLISSKLHILKSSFLTMWSKWLLIWWINMCSQELTFLIWDFESSQNMLKFSGPMHSFQFAIIHCNLSTVACVSVHWSHVLQHSFNVFVYVFSTTTTTLSTFQFIFPIYYPCRCLFLSGTGEQEYGYMQMHYNSFARKGPIY